MYKFDHYLRKYDIESYHHGIIKEGITTARDLIMEDSDLSSLITRILKYFEVNYEEISLNACDEDGRIDIYKYLDLNGLPPTKQQIKEWEEGKINLINVIYTIRILEVFSKPVKLPEEK